MVLVRLLFTAMWFIAEPVFRGLQSIRDPVVPLATELAAVSERHSCRGLDASATRC